MGQSIVTSRPSPQQMAQIFSPFAGQNRFGGRFSQIGQRIHTPWADKKRCSAEESEYEKTGDAASGEARRALSTYWQAAGWRALRATLSLGKLSRPYFGRRISN